MSDYRNNFHEDSLRHYVLKAQNHRADGNKVGCKPRKKASQKSMREVLELGECNATVRERLLLYVDAPEADPVAKLLSKYDKATQDKIRAILAA